MFSACSVLNICTTRTTCIFYERGCYLCLAGTVSYWALAAFVFADDDGVLATERAAPATGVLRTMRQSVVGKIPNA